MKHTDFFAMTREIKKQELEELKRALRLHNNSFEWGDNKEQPIVAANLNGGPTDIYVSGIHMDIENDIVVINGTDEFENQFTINPADCFAGHLSTIIDYLPATQKIEDVSQEKVYACVKLMKDDINSIGFVADDLSDDDIVTICSKMNNAYCDGGFWDDLGIICEDFGVKSKTDVWFLGLPLELKMSLLNFTNTEELDNEDLVDELNDKWNDLPKYKREEIFETKQHEGTSNDKYIDNINLLIASANNASQTTCDQIKQFILDTLSRYNNWIGGDTDNEEELYDAGGMFLDNNSKIVGISSFQGIVYVSLVNIQTQSGIEEEALNHSNMLDALYFIQQELKNK